MAPMNEEQKSKLLARLKEGRARVKAAREDAKAKGLPDPKPRKARGPKKPAGVIADPEDAPSANDKIAPIDGAPANAVNAVAAVAPDPGVTKSKPIDVPNLPGEGKEVASKKDIVKDAEAVPAAAPRKGLSSTGKPTKVNVNDELLNQETGDSVVSPAFAGQKENIKRSLKADKKDAPLASSAVPDPPSKTTRNVKSHVPDMKAVEGRAPFSFSAIRKALYQ
jgi:hypothetical protein